MDEYKYDWVYGEVDLDTAHAAEEEVLDRTSEYYWQSLALLETGLQRMSEEDEREATQHAEERKAALAAARAKVQSLQQQLRDRAQFRVQQWQTELQRTQAELAVARLAEREKIAARLNAMQERQTAAAAKMRSHFEARVADIQALRDKLNAQLAAAQAGAKADLEQRKQESEDHLAKAKHDLESFNSATAAAQADLQQGRELAEADMAAARKQALSEFHTQKQQLDDQVHGLQEQIQNATAPARDKIAAQIAALKQQRAAAQQKMSDMLEARVQAAQARLDKIAADIAAANAANLAALQADLKTAQADLAEGQHELATFGQQANAAFGELDRGIIQAHDDLKAARARAGATFNN